MYEQQRKITLFIRDLHCSCGQRMQLAPPAAQSNKGYVYQCQGCGAIDKNSRVYPIIRTDEGEDLDYLRVLGLGQLATLRGS